MFINPGKQAEDQDCEEHPESCVEWDTYLLWYHGRRHVQKNTQVA